MSDQAPSGEPSTAPATAVDSAATPAAPTGETQPMGSFGNARGSGLARGKRATPAAAPTAGNSNAAYKPTSVSVITPKREYTNPFAPEPAPAAPVAAEAVVVPPTENPNGPVASASEPPAVTAPASGEPVAPPAQVIQPSVEKAEIKVLPPTDAKRPTVSWGESHDAQEQRSSRETRPTFNPDRRGEPREPRRDPRNFEPRDSGKAQDTRFPRRDTALEQRDRSRENRDYRAPSGEPVKKSGGFMGWLKGLFGGKPAEPAQPAQQGNREQRDGEFHRRRHRGGRGRGGGGGFQGENRGPRTEGQQGGQNFQGGEGADNQGERRFEGGGGGGGGYRRRRRGGRGRYRDDRGPRPEGQQGGGAI